MTGSESSGPNTNLWFFVAGRREGILKRCSTQDIREVRRGTQRYQKPSTVLESSNLVCKEIKCTLTPGYCVCRHPTACLSPFISRDLRTSYEGRDSAHGHKCSWAWDSNTVRPCHKKQMAMGVAQLVESLPSVPFWALGSIPSLPYMCIHTKEY